MRGSRIAPSDICRADVVVFAAGVEKAEAEPARARIEQEMTFILMS
jgi:hypothetical protein